MSSIQLKLQDLCSYLTVACVFLLFVCGFLVLQDDRYIPLLTQKGEQNHIHQCCLVVPDIIHFYRSNILASEINETEAACLRAAAKYHTQVWLHSTHPLETKIALKSLKSPMPPVRILKANVYHNSSYLAILREHGGIFLKNDIFLLKDLNYLRRFELCKVGNDEIVAASKLGTFVTSPIKLEGILFDRDYGILYLIEAKNYFAVRLGFR